jgi:Protein of unknown function (DUF1045).
MANYPRYAIYYTADARQRARPVRRSLLGYDAYGGDDLPFPDGLPLDWRDLTQDPRKYGFHATLKAPMALADGKAEARLPRHANCSPIWPGRAGDPTGRRFDQRFHRGDSGRTVGRSRTARAEATKAFDPFRAPLSPEDRARRNPGKLTPRQRDYLDRWGYPYVFENFAST